MLDRWRPRTTSEAGAEPEPAAPGAMELLEDAPVVALLLDGVGRVIAANALARSFFGIREDQLPASLVEATRESRLEEALARGEETEIRLAHQQRQVLVRSGPGPIQGQTLLYLVDVSQLRRLETVRQEFVANLSHELKTPLTSLRLAAESLTADLPPEATAMFVQRILREADHLAAIVGNLSQLAELETGAVTLRLEGFGLEALIEEVRERLALARQLQMQVPKGLQVTADRSKLAQVLATLLDNAAKFSPPGSPIEVIGRSDTSEVVVEIRDHGPGISPEHWERVFERFYKVDPARSRETPGSGLGLAIAKHLVLLHGGRLWTGAAPEGGQIFAFALPTRRAHHVA
jgi:two-component system phosphate regulon sensor histidine kinase PhoR